MIASYAWNPAIGLPEAVALGLGFVLLGSWLAWRGSAAARGGVRASMLLLRCAGLMLVALFWLNPGQWLGVSPTVPRSWTVLLDRSTSMQAEQAEGTSRWQSGVSLAGKLRSALEEGRVRVHPFASQLEDETATPGNRAADGTATDLGRAIASALDQRAAPLAGLVVLSDGRQTTRAKLDEIALRARGRGVPIHVVPLGLGWGSRDLQLTALPRQVTAYKGQGAKISAQVENRGLGPIKPVVVLTGPDGKEIARKDVALAEGARQTVVFDVPVLPEAGGEYGLEVAAWPGEHVPANNRDSVRVSVLTSKTRVLLLEGAPYWDSKFLAQLLRQQGAVDILTVHRLNEERYFRVDAAGAEPLLSPDTVFPRTAAELSRYDLIVFGKGADGFLDVSRVAALQGFVRDQGGAVLFARGKPYRGRFAPLESFEPVEWGEPLNGGARFTPVPDTGAGLFGAALPAAEDRVWGQLPLLEDATTVPRLKPFARVLAEGVIEGRQTKIPLLVVRRFGRGMVATVNADGLWRWDFHPEIREMGGVYQQFWVQLMQWCATYSEFRPGQDYAVRLPQTTGEPGQPLRAIIAYRGPATPAPAPSLSIVRAGQPAVVAAATPLPDTEGNREWAAMVTPDQPGRYEIRVADPSRPGKLEGDATLTVTAPPTEADDLRPDPDSLATLARESGGQVWKPEEIDRLAAALVDTDPVDRLEKPRWEPFWPQWWVAVLVTLAFGGEWWLRRREGLL